MTMEVIHLSKPFAVQVYSECISNNQSPWIRIGEFDYLCEAIEACKNVVDDFLCSPINVFISPDRLVSAFLSYGDVPAIIGAENLKSFDVYEYLTQRCKEISCARESNPILI